MNESEVQFGLEKLKQEWTPKGFKCEIYTTNKTESWTNQGHKADEFIILIEGEIEISFLGKTHRPAIGEVLKIPAKIPHSFKIFAKPTSRMYWVYAFDWQWNEDGSAVEEGKVLTPQYDF